MSEEDRTLETVVKMLSTCIEQRDTLKRERDEARARVKMLEDVQRNCCLENGECGLAGILDHEDQPTLQEQSK
jgi:hypothetical protein